MPLLNAPPKTAHGEANSDPYQQALQRNGNGSPAAGRSILQSENLPGDALKRETVACAVIDPALANKIVKSGSAR
jgi:hypothetical protein